MTRHRATLAILGVTLGAWLSPACGGESEEDGKNTATGGTGGADAASDVVAEAKPDVAPDTNKCVDSDCPGIGSYINGCCLKTGECGYDGSALGYGCVSQEEVSKLLEGGLDVQVPPDATDPNCPDYTVAGYKLKGCCPTTGFCGVYAPIINQCYDWGQMPSQVPKPDNIVPTPCGSGADAAPEASSDAAGD
ncbi:MAG: hypothetical protein IT377_07665 [Polyangiaceae bacterium]|nr:hypothetical protein [Polyangiaceae bacterium]